MTVGHSISASIFYSGDGIASTEGHKKLCAIHVLSGCFNPLEKNVRGNVISFAWNGTPGKMVLREPPDLSRDPTGALYEGELNISFTVYRDLLPFVSGCRPCLWASL